MVRYVTPYNISVCIGIAKHSIITLDIQPRILVLKSVDRDFGPISAILSDVGVICPNILRYSFEVMQLGGWAIYLTSVLSSTTPDSIIYSKDYRFWGGIKVISAILSGFLD